MPISTPGYVRNMIRRSFREIADPGPTNKVDITKIWEFFESRCAYCGRKLNRENKEGHIDHLVSSSSGGRNHISNRVLSCADCNAEEKLDKPWEEFLAQKVSEGDLMDKRKERILQWQKENVVSQIDPEILDKVNSMSNDVIELYDQKVSELRELCKSNNFRC